MALTHVREFNWGVYVALSDGKYVINSEGDYLSIPSEYNNAQKIRKLIKTAKSYGLENVSVEFIDGAYQISEEEYQNQKSAQASGLLLPGQDPGAFRDEQRRLNRK